MASMTLTVVGPHVGEFSKTYNVSDADAPKILAAWGAKIGSADPRVIVDGIAETIMNDVLRVTYDHDVRVAMEQAKVAVQVVEATPEPSA